MERGRLVIWDFDGTLAHRPGFWSSCVIEVLDDLQPGHGVTREQIATGLRNGFPWDAWQDGHAHLTDDEAWWEPVEQLMAGAARSAGIATEQAKAAARAARVRFIDGAFSWQIYDDAHSALDRLSAAGWRHAVLSNHVPELGALVEQLGLRRHFDHVHTSARIGYEKPHPQAFAIALRASGNPPVAWMIGDNPHADVEGAERAGLPGILVHREPMAVARQADTLTAAAELILSEAP